MKVQTRTNGPMDRKLENINREINRETVKSYILLCCGHLYINDNHVPRELDRFSGVSFNGTNLTECMRAIEKRLTTDKDYSPDSKVMRFSDYLVLLIPNRILKRIEERSGFHRVFALSYLDRRFRELSNSRIKTEL